jgi:hypothetical protein
VSQSRGGLVRSCQHGEASGAIEGECHFVEDAGAY